jgi:hypothetical protein
MVEGPWSIEVHLIAVAHPSPAIAGEDKVCV